MKQFVSVIGSGICTAEESEFAYDVGWILAERGYGVVCGGLGGVMASACWGSAEHGGTTMGILPGSDLSEANSFVQIAIPTGLGEARNTLVVRAGIGAIAIGGEFGTLTEIAYALKLGKRVVGIDTWSIQRDQIVSPIICATNAEEAVNLLLGKS